MYSNMYTVVPVGTWRLSHSPLLREAHVALRPSTLPRDVLSPLWVQRPAGRAHSTGAHASLHTQRLKLPQPLGECAW